jgi:lipid-A-disaccharide synthase
VPIYCLTGQTRQVLEASDVVLVTSGTATLETMLYKKPMVIAYKTNALTYWLAKKLIKTPYIGLPNILAQAPLVPEYLQQEATPAKLGAALEQLLNLSESQRQQLINRFTTLHRSLQQNANQKAGDVVLKLLGA